ncbi:hypothetical protein QEZ54_07710 [Catellatospora sp. KI3]|uniref:hypothetical protein n=1 Tax=Catellatospora sp. KI3 TaxID=3041620 RepID=UPI0024824181|nr:hypothetical protein [Catellatospora sp. KI3]MDI1460847.1 hypothetical protein [Catellatospora sp. KI3]
MITIAEGARAHRIDRRIYGQFAEHLGRGVYEGLWVGEDSPIAHRHGIRSDVVAALRAIEVPLVRWPGGCFADEYHRQRGIGPRAERAASVNTHCGARPVVGGVLAESCLRVHAAGVGPLPVQRAGHGLIPV